jgi:hypothetical protein
VGCFQGSCSGITADWPATATSSIVVHHRPLLLLVLLLVFPCETLTPSTAATTAAATTVTATVTGCCALTLTTGWAAMVQHRSRSTPSSGGYSGTHCTCSQAPLSHASATRRTPATSTAHSVTRLQPLLLLRLLLVLLMLVALALLVLLQLLLTRLCPARCTATASSRALGEQQAVQLATSGSQDDSQCSIVA